MWHKSCTCPSFPCFPDKLELRSTRIGRSALFLGNRKTSAASRETKNVGEIAYNFRRGKVFPIFERIDGSLARCEQCAKKGLGKYYDRFGSGDGVGECQVYYLAARLHDSAILMHESVLFREIRKVDAHVYAFSIAFRLSECLPPKQCVHCCFSVFRRRRDFSNARVVRKQLPVFFARLARAVRRGKSASKIAHFWQRNDSKNEPPLQTRLPARLPAYRVHGKERQQICRANIID